MKPDDLSAFRRLNAMDGNWRIVFDKDGLVEGLWEIAMGHNLSDKELRFVASLEAAITGTHPNIRVKLDDIPEGVTPRRIEGMKRQALAQRVADHVDMQVADGVKQEAAILDAINRFGVSRREVFRMLNEVRSFRLQLLDWDNPYDGYDVGEDGRLVPKENSG